MAISIGKRILASLSQELRKGLGEKATHCVANLKNPDKLPLFRLSVLTNHRRNGDNPLLAVFADIDTILKFSIGDGFS